MMNSVEHSSGSIWRCLLGVLVMLSVAGSTQVEAQPRTMYKPRDIENAKQNIERYEWAETIFASWKAATDFAMQQDREFFEQLIPDLTPDCQYGQTCPHCVGQKSVQGRGNFIWRVNRPEEVTCRDCGTVYPNDEYPETGIMELPRMGQTFTYYQTPGERALPPDATYEQRAEHAFRWSGWARQTSFSGLIRYYRLTWAIAQTLNLAKVYAITGDVAYAERVAWILDRFGRVFPSYLFHNYDGTFVDMPPAEVAARMGQYQQEVDHSRPSGPFPIEVVKQPYGRTIQDGHATLQGGFFGSGRIRPHGKGSDSGPLLNMTVAYDLTRDAHYPDGTAVYDEQMHARIISDLLEAGCADMEHWKSLGNKGVATRSLSAAVGMLLEQPERVRRGLDGFNQIMELRYHFDGFFWESPGYAAHSYGNMRELPEILYGYSDPPDYRPAEGERIENFNPYEMGQLQLALEAMVRMLAPGNGLPVIGDTVQYTRLSVLYAEALAARLGGRYARLLEILQGASLSDAGSEYALWYRPADMEAAHTEAGLPLRSEWFPGWHVAVLRGGRATHNDTALYLNGDEWHWTIPTSHRQNDILNISYYAFGEELVVDRGYIPSGVNAGGRDTKVHNLVIVDEQDQNRRMVGSNLELFGVAPGVEVVQASGFQVYSQCAQYRRTCALIRAPDEHTYAVDFFRVTGGATHQYSFQCNGTLVALHPPGPEPQPVTVSSVWQGWMNSPGAVTPEQPYTFTWEYRDIKLDLMMVNTTDNLDRIVIGDTTGWRIPAPRPDRQTPPIQQILAENRIGDSDETFTSQYVALIVPYRSDASPILSARLLENDRESGVIAIEVQLAERSDYIISTRDQQQRQFGPVTVAGEFAFVSVDDAGNAVQGYLLSGTRLECAQLQIDLPEPTTRLDVRDVDGRTIHLVEPLPEGLCAPGSYLLSSGPIVQRPVAGRDSELVAVPDAARPITGFEIQSSTGDSITVRDYPVPESAEVTLLHGAWVVPER